MNSRSEHTDSNPKALFTSHGFKRALSAAVSVPANHTADESNESINFETDDSQAHSRHNQNEIKRKFLAVLDEAPRRTKEINRSRRHDSSTSFCDDTFPGPGRYNRGRELSGLISVGSDDSHEHDKHKIKRKFLAVLDKAPKRTEQRTSRRHESPTNLRIVSASDPNGQKRNRKLKKAKKSKKKRSKSTSRQRKKHSSTPKKSSEKCDSIAHTSDDDGWKSEDSAEYECEREQPKWVRMFRDGSRHKSLYSDRSDHWDHSLYDSKLRSGDGERNDSERYDGTRWTRTRDRIESTTSWSYETDTIENHEYRHHRRLRPEDHVDKRIGAIRLSSSYYTNKHEIHEYQRSRIVEPNYSHNNNKIGTSDQPRCSNISKSNNFNEGEHELSDISDDEDEYDFLHRSKETLFASPKNCKPRVSVTKLSANKSTHQVSCDFLEQTETISSNMSLDDQSFNDSDSDTEDFFANETDSQEWELEMLQQKSIETTADSPNQNVENELDCNRSPSEEEEQCEDTSNIGDYLTVDWAGFVEACDSMKLRKTTSEISTKQRWGTHNILLSVGVSFRMAGEKFASKTLHDAHRKLANECRSVTPTNNNVSEGDGRNELANKNASEDISVDSVPYEQREHIHPVAAAQVIRRSVFNSTASETAHRYSRGIYAERDIAMRRRLCDLAISENNGKTFAPLFHSPYEDMAIKLFKKAIVTSAGRKKN